MPDRSDGLPFPTNKTFFAQSGTDATSTVAESYVGLRYTLSDRGTKNTDGTWRRPATNQPVEVMIVRNTSGGTLRLGKALRGSTCSRLVNFETGSDFKAMVHVNRKAGNGERCLPIHDALNTGIPNLDLFYVVTKGPCEIRSTGSTAINARVGSDASGLGVPASTGDVIIGTHIEAAETGNVLRTIYVDSIGIAPSA